MTIDKKFKLYKKNGKYIMELDGFKYSLTKTQVIELTLNVDRPYMVLTPMQYLNHTINIFKSKK